MRLIFIRHGDPDYENDTLTEKGWREAKLLKERVCRWDVTEFYCSPLGRAIDTASLSLNRLGRTAHIEDWLQEFFYLVKDPDTGEQRIAWDLMPAHWTNEPLLYDKDNWINAPIMQTGEVAAHYKEVCDGIDEVLASYGYVRTGGYYKTEQKSDATLVFFCHLGVTFALLSHLLGMSPSILWQGFFIAPTSVTVLNAEERVPGDAYFRCQVLGDTNHLRNGGEPISQSGYFSDVFQC